MGGTTALDLVQGITECALCGRGLLRSCRGERQLKAISEKPAVHFGVCSPACPKLSTPPQQKTFNRFKYFLACLIFQDVGFLDILILFSQFGTTLQVQQPHCAEDAVYSVW